MKNELSPPEAPAIPLLHCPFCGLPARMEVTPVPNFAEYSKGNKHVVDSYSYHIECTAPNALRCPSKHWLSNSPEEAAKNWNARKPTAPQSESGEGVKG